MALLPERCNPLPARQSTLGQALVETALLMPILLILLLGAIDFGRVFFGWVNLHQAARIGANFAAAHPDMTPSERAAYVTLIEGDTAGLNCDLEDPLPNPIYTRPDGTPTGDPVLGDYSVLMLECDFTLVTPLAGILFGDPINLDATATFPVRDGCVNCPTPAPATPPPTPVQCRQVPDMVGMSVAGARLAWGSAGFFTSNFTPATGDDTLTVATAPVTQTALSTCTSPLAIFDSSVTVTTEGPDPVGAGCATVPNVIGLSVADARAAWDADFDSASFTPDIADDARKVDSQATSPSSTPGVTCLDLAASMTVVTGDPWPAPPPTPCRVPNLIDLRRSEGAVKWADALFLGSYNPANGNFTIKSQTLVGGTYVTCEASITVSATP